MSKVSKGNTHLVTLQNDLHFEKGSVNFGMVLPALKRDLVKHKLKEYFENRKISITRIETFQSKI